VLLHREGWRVNAKRVYRLYTQEQLIVRIKRQKIARRQRVATPLATTMNQCWSTDLVSDKLGTVVRFAFSRWWTSSAGSAFAWRPIEP
jgi:hypothetical protein